MSVSPGARLLRLAALVVLLAALHALFTALAWLVALVAASVAVVAVADLLALRRLPRVSIDRLVVDRAAIGVRSRIALRIGNASTLDRTVDVLEELPPDVVPHEPSFAGVAVPAGAATCIEYEVCPRRRGDRALGPTVAFEPSRLALWRRRTSFNEGQVLRVHPDVRHLRRAAALDVIAVPQTIFLPALGNAFRRYLPDSYLPRCYPVRAMLDAGLTVALSSDAPVVPDDNPLAGIKAAVDRRDPTGAPIAPEQAISAREALYAYTMGGAIASGDADNRGSLTPGKWADLAILSGDPLAVMPDGLPGLRVEQTYVGGRLASEA